MKNYPLKDISPSGFFTRPTYLDSQFVITAPEMPLTKKLAKSVSDWGFSEVYSDGEPSKQYSSDMEQAVTESDGDNTYAAIGDQSAIEDLEMIQQAENFCASFQKYVKTLFAFITIRDLDFNPIAEQIKNVCNYVREKRRYLLRTQWLTSPTHDEDEMVSHAVRSTIISLIIGISLKLQNYRLIELGVTALLHEVGMIKLPKGIFSKQGILSEQERKLLFAHPILGFNLLKASYNFPLVVSMGVLEHHERENGTGYPQRKTGDKISFYAKIIAVACSYEAMLSKRAHKGAKDGHSGILELMKNEGKQYDDAVIRALVYSLSIYPIGLYVLLSNGKKGQVVDSNPENPRFPVVQVFGELMPNGKNRTVQTSSAGCHVARPLTPDELSKHGE